MMRILEKYVLRELIKSFLLTFVVFTLIFFLLLLLQVIRRYSQFLTLLDILALTPYTIGRCAAFTIPLTMLASTTLIYGRMAYDNEILILRAAGIHFHRVFQPAFVLGLFLSGVCLYINGDIVPLTILKQREITYKALESILSVTFSSEETTIDFIPDVRIYYRKLEAGNFRNLVIQHIGQDQVAEEILAESGNLVYDPYKKLLTFHLQHGSINYIMRHNKSKQNLPVPQLKEERFFFDKISLPIALPKEEQRFNRDLDKFKNMKELWQRMQQFAVQEQQAAGRLALAKAKGEAGQIKAEQTQYDKAFDDHWDCRMEWHQRIAGALASLLVVLIGAPLGMIIRHDNRLVAFGVAAIPVLLIYYPLQIWGTSLGYQYILSPFWASWLANIIGTAIGIGLLWWVYKK
jgi:lipopolysaccharide export LptBFGC system permease protein LptF